MEWKVGVRFLMYDNFIDHPWGKVYYFNSNVAVEKGDYVICPVARGNGEFMVPAVVINPNANINSKPTKWIIDKVHMTGYFEREEKRKKIEDVKRRMDWLFDKCDKISFYRFFAQDDPEMTKLLKEYDDLMGYNDNDESNIGRYYNVEF